MIHIVIGGVLLALWLVSTSGPRNEAATAAPANSQQMAPAASGPR